MRLHWSRCGVRATAAAAVSAMVGRRTNRQSALCGEVSVVQLPWTTAAGVATLGARKRTLLGRTRSNHKLTPVQHAEKMAARAGWLVEHLGFPPERAERNAHRFVPMWDENLPRWLTWLQGRGYTQQECVAILRKYPQLLGVETDAGDRVVEWMRSERGPGLSEEQVNDLVGRAPAIFHKRTEKLQMMIDWLRSDNCKLRNPVQTIISSPCAMMASLHGRIRPRHDLVVQLQQPMPSITTLGACSDVNFAIRLGITAEELRAFERNGDDYRTARARQEMARRRRWIQETLDPEGMRDEQHLQRLTQRYTQAWERNFEPWMAWLQGGAFRLTEAEARRTLHLASELLAVPVLRAEHTVEWMMTSAPGLDGRSGWSKDFVVEAIRRAPAVFAFNASTLQGRVDWYTSHEYARDDQGTDYVADRLQSNPLVLTGSIACRVRPRHAFASSRGVFLSPSRLALGSDATVARAIQSDSGASCTLADVQQAMIHFRDSLPSIHL
jgi:hypothetical protein